MGATILGAPASCGRSRGEKIPAMKSVTLVRIRPQDAGVPSDVPSAKK